MYDGNLYILGFNDTETADDKYCKPLYKAHEYVSATLDESAQTDTLAAENTDSDSNREMTNVGGPVILTTGTIANEEMVTEIEAAEDAPKKLVKYRVMDNVSGLRRLDGNVIIEDVRLKNVFSNDDKVVTLV